MTTGEGDRLPNSGLSLSLSPSLSLSADVAAKLDGRSLRRNKPASSSSSVNTPLHNSLAGCVAPSQCSLVVESECERARRAKHHRQESLSHARPQAPPPVPTWWLLNSWTPHRRR
ncbi:hypothetical protein JDV02_009200 [Purpureocillium takamizusanense]|uniref:Uncharacterized protein n=1 Tax=Purpureocillium takamizusanense TaxID=2060973 RepID=A0A9Q8VFF5_9HYPO|nr:uncharacterized protein JDV02_009200 [Purpureocillium takamizusanense]UNI23376.1 hypothetical protein JDV02_009200 [Purpureocillium takamizusanense]